jgi:L-asparaginase II
MPPLAAMIRSGRVESIHSGYICGVGADGTMQFSIGDPQTLIFLRSSAKPFIATTFVQSGAMEKFHITEQELAIICSSHAGEEVHIHVVKSILHKIGLGEESLQCGHCDPYNQQSKNELIQNKQRPSQLHNCCSGKHAGMLAVCKMYNYPLENYTDVKHPIQQRIHDQLAKLLDCKRQEIIVGEDGCGVPGFMTSMQKVAYLYALLADGGRGRQEFREPLTRIRDSMIRYPHLTGGTEEFSTAIMQGSKKPLIVKAGDEGVYGAALLESKMGIALKIEDGNERACYSAMMQIIRQLNMVEEYEAVALKQWAYPPINNHKGTPIGYIMPTVDIHNTNYCTGIKSGDVMLGEGGFI